MNLQNTPFVIPDDYEILQNQFEKRYSDDICQGYGMCASGFIYTHNIILYQREFDYSIQLKLINGSGNKDYFNFYVYSTKERDTEEARAHMLSFYLDLDQQTRTCKSPTFPYRQPFLKRKRSHFFHQKRLKKLLNA